MTSISYMEKIQSRILKSFGFTSIKGSSARGVVVRVFVKIIGHVLKGSVAVFVVDGPTRSCRKIKSGSVCAAQKVGVSVLPVNTSVWPSVVFDWVWDRYLLPLPFSKYTVHFCEPFILDTDLSNESVTQACNRIDHVLTDLDVEADSVIARTRK